MWDTWLYMGLLGLSAGGYMLSFAVLSPPLRWVAVHQLLTLAGMGVALAYVYVAKQHNNQPIFHVLAIGQYSLLAAMYAESLATRSLRRLAWLSIPVFALIAILIATTIQPWHHINSYAATLSNLLITFWAGSSIRILFNDPYIQRIEREPIFWISAGLFFTSLGNFFVQSLLNYLLQQSRQAALTVYWVEEMMGMIMTTLFIIALLVARRWLFRTH